MPLSSRRCARADAIEAARRLPADLIQELTDAGCFRLCTPQGRRARGPTTAALRVVEALAEAEASGGGAGGQAALAQIILGYRPRAAQEALYVPGPDLKAAGVFAPKGRATRTGDAWQVTGRWPFASGCEFASVIYLQCLVFEDRRVVLRDDGVPVTRLAVFPAGDCAILDTWDAGGLRARQPRRRIKNGVCLTADLRLAETDASGTDLQSVPLMDVAGLLIAAVAVGVAAGALSAFRSWRRPARAHPSVRGAWRRTRVPGRARRRAHVPSRGACLLYAQAAIIERAMAERPRPRRSCQPPPPATTSRRYGRDDGRSFHAGATASVPRVAPMNR